MKDNELALRIVQDHEKLDRTFSDLETTFIHIMEAGQGAEERDALEDARADLAFALEEMLEHFGIEEEAIFDHLRVALPDLAPRLDALEANHESFCAHTATLRKMVAAANAGAVPLDCEDALRILRKLKGALIHHNSAEVQLFLEALGRLDDEGQRLLRENLDRL